MKIINDTLKVKGKWSLKRVQTFSAFFLASVYAFVPIFLPIFEVKEFVFIGFLSIGGWSLYRTQKLNENTIVTE